MFCENGRSAIHVLNCEKCVKVRRRETTWDRRDTPRLPGGGNLVRRGFWFFFRFCRILPGRRPALRSPSSPGGGGLVRGYPRVSCNASPLART